MDPLVEFCRGLTAELQPRAAAIEEARRVPLEVMRRIAAQGLFRRCLPRDCGGDGGDPAVVLAALAALACADSSVGWCAMISVTTATFAAYMAPETARELFVADVEAISAGVFAPRGRAVRVDGGVRLTGRWEFASHCENAGWIGLGGLVGDAPAFRICFVPTAAAQVVPRWDVLGLRGTGSHDVVVDDVEVPERMVVAIGATTAPVLPFFGGLALAIAAVALGIAEAALAAFSEGAQRVPPGPGGKPLAVRPAVQQGLAAAIGRHSAARAYLFDEVGRAWTTVASGAQLDLLARARLRLAACAVVRDCVAVVDAAYHDLGGGTIRDGHGVQRRFRDIHTLTQHLMVGPVAYDMAARVLAGVPVETTML